MTPEETVRAYGAAWNEKDSAGRRRLLEASWAEAGVYSDPMNMSEGRDALDALIAGFHQGSPGASIAIASGVDEHHGFVRFQWRMEQADGSVTMEGFDVGELDADGRLRRITGFFGPFPPG